MEELKRWKENQEKVVSPKPKEGSVLRKSELSVVADVADRSVNAGGVSTFD